MDDVSKRNSACDAKDLLIQLLQQSALWLKAAARIFCSLAQLLTSAAQVIAQA